MLERHMVISRTANGFMVRGLSDVEQDRDVDENTFVFPDLDTMFNFLREHFYNVDKESKDEQSADQAESESVRPLFLPEEGA